MKFASKKIYKNFFFDEVWLIYPCAPLIKPKDLILASKKYQLTDKKFPMITVRKYDAPIEWSLKKKKNFFIPTDLSKINLDSKKTKTYYYESASFIIYNLLGKDLFVSILFIFKLFNLLISIFFERYILSLL